MSISNHPESQTAPANGYGLLSVFIQQVSDTSPSYTGGDVSDMRYTAIFYGPYIKAKDINDAVGKPLQSYLAGHRETFDQNFTFPALPGDDGEFVWVVKSTRVEQGKAGEHCMLYFDCEADLTSQITPGQDGWLEDPMQDSWSVRWQAYTMSPYAFCSNKLHVDPPCPQTTDPTLSGYAMREHVMKFLDDRTAKIENGHRAYNDGGNQYRFLNDAEDLVCDKVVKNVNALYHYPVLVHQTVTSKQLSAVSAVVNEHTKFLHKVGVSVDYTVTSADAELSDCPFTFPDAYVFVKQGDDVTKQKTTNPPSVRFVRVQTYQGMLQPDRNYYGHEEFDHDQLSSCRWKVASV